MVTCRLWVFKEMFSLYAKRGSRQGKSIDLKRWLTYKIPVYSEEDQIVIEDNLNKINVVKISF